VLGLERSYSKSLGKANKMTMAQIRRIEKLTDPIKYCLS
jgi:hypothetical protein